MFTFKDAINDLSVEDKLAIYEAITDYAFFEKIPELDSPMARMAWKFIEPVLKLSWVRFRAKKGKSKSNQNGIKTKSKHDMNKNKNKDKNKDIETCEETSQSLSFSPKEVEHGDYMNRFFPSVQKLKEPLTLDQFVKLCDEYGEEAVKDKLSAMENDKKLSAKYKSAYLTLRNWLKRDKK